MDSSFTFIRLSCPLILFTAYTNEIAAMTAAIVDNVILNGVNSPEPPWLPHDCGINDSS